MAAKKKVARKRRTTATPPTISKGAKRRESFRDDAGRRFTAVAWSPDGRTLAATCPDAVLFWDLETGRKTKLPIPGAGYLTSIAWAPNGKAVACGSGEGKLFVFLKLRYSGRGEVVSDKGHVLGGDRTPDSHPDSINGIAWAPDGRLLAVAGDSGIGLYDPQEGQKHRVLAGHDGVVVTVIWLPGSRTLASASADGAIGLWDVAEGKLLSRWTGHDEPAVTVACSPDGQTILSGGWDRTVRVWDRETGRQMGVLEGHRSNVHCVSVSADGRLAASVDEVGRILLWRLDTLRQVGTLSGCESAVSSWFSTLAFHPGQPALAAVQDGGETVDVWDLEPEVLLGRRARPDAAQYANVKVVLAGDTGVGKTGLSTVLAGEPFAASLSTHGRRVLTFETKKVGAVARETLLWDLAGQPGYRLVHQLRMDDASVALVLFDARSETDPFGAAGYWSQALDQTAGSAPPVKLLVASRADRGGVGVSQARIDEFVRAHGFAGFFRTSAKTGEGVEQLAEAIRGAIDWEQTPVVSSSRLFTEIRDYVRNRRRRGASPRLSTMTELHGAFCKARKSNVSKEDFEDCVRRLQRSDVVDVLVFSVLDEAVEPEDYVLIEPAYVDAYASAIVIAAKDEPDGIGHLRERDLLEGKFALEASERLAEKESERKVLVATLELLIEHEIALRERIDGEDYLVFPSQYTKAAPFPGSQSYGVRYEFAGPVKSIFTTLVVRLAHHSKFSNREFFQDAASYDSEDGGRCIVLFADLAEGRGRMSVFFEGDPSDSVQRAFLRYVYDHLVRKAVPQSITRRRAYHCGNCKHLMDDEVVEHRLKEGLPDIVCAKCDQRWPLYDLIRDEDPTVEATIRGIDEDARDAKSRQLAVTTIQGKKRIGEYDVFLSYNSEDRPEVLRIAEMLKAVGLRPWVDVWDLVPGKPWQRELEKAIERIDSVAVCIGGSGIGPWEQQEMEACLRLFVSRGIRVMPTLLKGAEAEPELPLFLEAFTWVDLREMGPDNHDPFKRLVAGIINRRPDDLRSQVVDAALVAKYKEESKRAEKRDKQGPAVTLTLHRSLGKHQELGIEAVRTQLAEQLDVPSSAVHVLGVEDGSLRINLEFDDTDDVMRLFALLRSKDHELQEWFKQWSAKPKQFIEENKEVAEKILPPIHLHVNEDKSVHIGGDMHDSSILSGDQNVPQQTWSKEPPPSAESVDILEELSRLRKACEAIGLDQPSKESVGRALSYAEDEANAPDADRSEVARMVDRVLKTVKDAKEAVTRFDELKVAVAAIAGWCGAQAGPILRWFSGG